MATYKFYIQEINKDGSIPTGGVTKDLEADYVGLRYKQCKGLNAIGMPRVYTEVYADSDRLRSYIPSVSTNEATEITLTLYFMGSDRQSTYDAFNAFICGGYRRYWDTARGKAFDFFVKGAIDVSKEMWYGGMPYFEVTYTLQNLNGRTKDV